MKSPDIHEHTYIANIRTRFPVEIVSGKGSIVYDTVNRHYIDMTGMIGTAGFGVADEEWIKAVDDQLHRICYMPDPHYKEPCTELAELLCLKTGMKKAFLCDSGTVADEYAISAAKEYAARRKGPDCNTVIILKNSSYGNVPGFISIDPGKDIFELEAVAARVKVAAVMIECIRLEDGMAPIEESFAKQLEDYCRSHDILLIADESRTGNGRSGRLFSYMRYGISPDIVTASGGGLPLGIVLLGERAGNIPDTGREYQASWLSAQNVSDHAAEPGVGNIACAGAVNIIKRLNEDFLENVRIKGRLMSDALRGCKGIENVSGTGLMAGIRTSLPVSSVADACIKRGVLCLQHGDWIQLLPALDIPENCLMEAMNIIKEVCTGGCF